jgi:hypothetical protein
MSNNSNNPVKDRFAESAVSAESSTAYTRERVYYLGLVHTIREFNVL